MKVEVSPLIDGSGNSENPRAHAPEAGFVLLDVVIASVVLAVTAFPMMALFMRSNSVLGQDRSSIIAANLASAQLDADRGQAQLQFPPSLTAQVINEPSSTGATTYKVAQKGGWCSPNTSGDFGNHGAANVGADNYWVKVTVTWPKNPTKGLAMSTSLPTPSSYAGSISTAGCPLP